MADLQLPELSRQQTAVLQAIYQVLRATGKWPTFQRIDRALDRAGLDINEIASTLPRGLTNVSVRPLNPTEEATLTLAGLLYIPEAEDDRDAFMKVLWYATDIERDYSESEVPIVTSADLESRVHLSHEELMRLHNLIRWEPWAGSGSWGQDQFEFQVTREVRQFRGVQTFGDYVLRRLEGINRAFPPFAPVPVPPPRAPGLDPGLAVQRNEAKRVFVIMPFDRRLNPVYAAIQQACQDLGVEVRRSDEITEAGKITEQIYEALRGSDVIVADITGRNPNVMYELGYAHGIKQAVILLNSGKTAPFDLIDYRQIRYRVDDLDALRNSLTQFLRTALRLEDYGGALLTEAGDHLFLEDGSSARPTPAPGPS